MISNIGGTDVGILAMQHAGRVGHLYSPGGERGPWRELPFGIDNDAWAAFLNKRPRNHPGWLATLRWAALSGIPPLFALVPDVVGDRDATLRAWDEHEATVRQFGFRQAFAVQDGMTFDDVPTSDCVLFLAGGDEFKDAAIKPWCARFPGRVHVGRVNGMPRLLASYHAGAISVDGTGWFRKGRGGFSQANDLRKFLRETKPA